MRRMALAMLAVSVLGGCAAPGSNDDNGQDLAAIYADMALGHMQRQPPDYLRAKEKLEKALEADPNLVRAHHYAAELYARTDEPAKAEHHFRQAMELAPRDPNLKNNFGAFLCARNRYPEAEEQFLAAIGDPAYTTPQLAYENLARCALRAPNAAKAERYFNEALKRQPNLPVSLFHMAQLQYDKREYFKARAFLERYLGVGAATPQVLLLAVHIEKALGDSAMVAHYAQELRSNFPDSSEAAALREILSKPGPEAGHPSKPLEVQVSEEVLRRQEGAVEDEASTTTQPPAAAAPTETNNQTSAGGADRPQ